jgi:hypothetical protein
MPTLVIYRVYFPNLATKNRITFDEFYYTFYTALAILIFYIYNIYIIYIYIYIYIYIMQIYNLT